MASRSENGESSAPAPGLREAAPPIELAISIEKDFRALVELLSNRPEGNGELADHLRRARNAAAQGLRLSERLVKMARQADSAKSIPG